MESVIKDFITKDKTLFEDVADNYSNVHSRYDTEYTVLDYEKIMSRIIEYLEGYIKYKDSGDDKYSGKVLTTTHSFYDNMFSDKEYRTKISLCEYRGLNKSFLEKTKELQTLLDKCSEDKTRTEMCALCEMTNRQYRKISKVVHDDMKIYLWLVTSNSAVFHKELDGELRNHFYDKSTPVIHQAKNND